MVAVIHACHRSYIVAGISCATENYNSLVDALACSVAILRSRIAVISACLDARVKHRCVVRAGFRAQACIGRHVARLPISTALVAAGHRIRRCAADGAGLTIILGGRICAGETKSAAPEPACGEIHWAFEQYRLARIRIRACAQIHTAQAARTTPAPACRIRSRANRSRASIALAARACIHTRLLTPAAIFAAHAGLPAILTLAAHRAEIVRSSIAARAAACEIRGIAPYRSNACAILAGLRTAITACGAAACLRRVARASPTAAAGFYADTVAGHKISRARANWAGGYLVVADQRHRAYLLRDSQSAGIRER